MVEARSLPRRASPKKHSEDDLVTAFLKNFTISIRQELNLRQVKRCEMSGAEIWKKLEENLGYDKKKFLEHIKSQFEDWMNLNNRGRSMSLDNPNWQLDHIKPKSSFSYTSMEDEGFKECWGLPNLRPVETCINQIKGKCENLHEGAVRSFMRGLHDGRSGGAGSEDGRGRGSRDSAEARAREARDEALASQSCKPGGGDCLNRFAGDQGGQLAAESSTQQAGSAFDHPQAGQGAAQGES